MWLLTAHTIAAANDVDPTVPGSPFDSTPEIFDSQFFLETQLKGTAFTGRGAVQGEVTSPLRGEFRLQSDFAIARDQRTACEWQSFVNNQTKVQQMFQFVFHDLSILGQNIDDLVDCTEVVRISIHYQRMPNDLTFFRRRSRSPSPSPPGPTSPPA